VQNKLKSKPSKPLIGFLVLLVQNLWPKSHKIVNFTIILCAALSLASYIFTFPRSLLSLSEYLSLLYLLCSAQGSQTLWLARTFCAACDTSEFSNN